MGGASVLVGLGAVSAGGGVVGAIAVGGGVFASGKLLNACNWSIVKGPSAGGGVVSSLATWSAASTVPDKQLAINKAINVFFIL